MRFPVTTVPASAFETIVLDEVVVSRYWMCDVSVPVEGFDLSTICTVAESVVASKRAVTFAVPAVDESELPAPPTVDVPFVTAIARPVGVADDGEVLGIENAISYKEDMQEFLINAIVPDVPISISVEILGAEFFA